MLQKLNLALRLMRKKTRLKYVGTITYKALRDLICDEQLLDNDTLVLHQDDFDSIVLAYREFYNVSFRNPHLLCGVLIRESEGEDVPRNRVGIIENDLDSVREINSESDSVEEEIVYRCGFCGSVVDRSGNKLNVPERIRAIQLLEKENRDYLTTKRIVGSCCREN